MGDGHECVVVKLNRGNQSCVEHWSADRHASKLSLPYIIFSFSFLFFRFDNIRLNIDALKLLQRSRGGGEERVSLATYKRSAEMFLTG